MLWKMDEISLLIDFTTGAACNSHSTEVSHVLHAIGLPDDVAKGTLRVTFGHGNTVQDAELIANTLISLLSKIDFDG